MTITIETYEDWGPVDNSIEPYSRGCHRTAIQNASISTICDPAQKFYLEGGWRKSGRPQLGQAQYGQYSVFTRHLSFKISSSSAGISNVAITFTPGFAACEWYINYGLNNKYIEPRLYNTGRSQQYIYDEPLQPLVYGTRLTPFISTRGPEDATHLLDAAGATEVWTQYLVLQYVGRPETFVAADSNPDFYKIFVSADGLNE